jgi:hypothetical protein
MLLLRDPHFRIFVPFAARNDSPGFVATFSSIQAYVSDPVKVRGARDFHPIILKGCTAARFEVFGFAGWFLAPISRSGRASSSTIVQNAGMQFVPKP